MSRKRKVTLRAQWLGKLLKELRLENELTLKEVGEHIRRDFTTLSRFEAGIQPIHQSELLALMDLYGLEGENQRNTLLQLGQEQTKTGWWEKYSKQAESWFLDYLWVESRAQTIRAYDAMPVNGLLQTPEYAEAWIRAVNPNESATFVERGVELRLARQRVLVRDEPMELSVIMDEAALHRLVGGRDVMKAQLRHLMDQSTHPHIELRVLPYSAGEHASPDGGFSLIKMEDPFPQIAYTLGPAGGLYLEAEQADKLDGMLGRLRSVSLDCEESVALIAALEKRL
ncbi:helix-turn-helix domain-containing protein [Allosalinactinospora lopnorensis]|uniref:helix-turn-helix domain-containing protein n=1 Tax=Allosalinactinospora lopnorensis TaxID=1352348 RepID=UPI000623D163|nr:helix-turn-helix transcriptional regulator [Allosalinactinospora lopnorensis]